jgi:hypothetical protein
MLNETESAWVERGMPCRELARETCDGIGNLQTLEALTTSKMTLRASSGGIIQ